MGRCLHPGFEMPGLFVKSRSFVEALTMGDRPVLDWPGQKHAAYRQMLLDAGYELTVIPADENWRTAFTRTPQGPGRVHHHRCGGETAGPVPWRSPWRS